MAGLAITGIVLIVVVAQPNAVNSTVVNSTAVVLENWNNDYTYKTVFEDAVSSTSHKVGKCSSVLFDSVPVHFTPLPPGENCDWFVSQLNPVPQNPAEYTG